MFNCFQILHCISKLYNLPVTVQHLQETGVGRTVNSFRKYDGSVGDASKALVYKWKRMVAAEDSSGREDEDETCVPDVHESHTDDNQESPKLKDMDIEENSSDQASNSKYTCKGNKSEPSTRHNTIHSSKSKSEETHEKSGHSSKHRSHSEKKLKESKGSKSSPKKEEAHNSTIHYHSDNDNLKKINDKMAEVNEDNRKRKIDNANFLTKESKKRKLSNSKIDDEKSQLPASGRNHSHSKSFEIETEVKIKVKDEQFLTSDKNKQDDKLKKYLQEKSSSSKLKSEELANKAKDNSEKQKHKIKEHTSYNKHDKKKDSSHHTNKETSKSRFSSSSIKDHVKNNERDKKKEHKEDKNKHEKKKETKIKLMQDIKGNEGIDCNSGVLNE